MGRVAAELLARLARLVHARRRVLQNAWTQIAVGGLVTRRDVITWMASLASGPESERRARTVRATMATRALALALPAAEDSVRRDRFRALVRRACFALALLCSGGSADAAVDRSGFVHCAVATTLVHESDAAAAFDRAVGRGAVDGQRAHTKEDIERRALVAPEAIRTFCDIRGSHVDAKLDASVRRAATRATAHVKSISPARRNATGLTMAPRTPSAPPPPSPPRDVAAERAAAAEVLDRDRIKVCFYLPLHFKRILLTILTCPPHILTLKNRGSAAPLPNGRGRTAARPAAPLGGGGGAVTAAAAAQR